MNDFTKDELEQIVAAICCLDGFMDERGYPREDELLINKLQSMIDNYCEHDFNEKSVELHAKQCCKCQEVKVL